ncbi:MAG: hypothetical protein AAF382_01580 [Pseudomonadota bacterium]
MKPQPLLTRRAAFATTLGLALSPLVIASAAAARGGPDPWKPNKKKTKSNRPGAPRQR